MAVSGNQPPGVRRRLPKFVSALLWSMIGILGGVGMAAMLTVGPLVLLVACLPLLVVQRWGESGNLVWFMGTGWSLPFLLIAWLNRHGPGDWCRENSEGFEVCTEMWTPWPFLIIGSILLIGTTFLGTRPNRQPPVMVWRNNWPPPTVPPNAF